MSAKASIHPPKKRFKWTGLDKAWELYLLLIPALVLLVIFSYGPMYGVLIAFKDFSAVKGVWGSKWVGLKHFIRFFESYNFPVLLRNTLTLSIYSLIAGFPLPIILALLVNKLRFPHFKQVVQTVSYAPHFISTVVLVGMLKIFFAPGTGMFNRMIVSFGGTDFDYFGSSEAFKHLYVLSDVWKNVGWNSIIYIAALTNIDAEQYESAICDGAGRLRILWNIDLPSIVPTIVTLLILNVGGIMSVGYEKAFLMQTTLNTSTSEIISTYVYKVGLQEAQFSFSTAVNVFNSVVNCILLVAVNMIARSVGETSLW